MIHLVGIGPGDPELLTVKAVRLIVEADAVYVPQSREDGRSLAARIIAPYADREKIQRAHVPMRPDRGAALAEYRALALDMAGRVERGERLVFVTLGDPMLYSTAQYLAEELESLRLDYAYVPGIPSFTAAANAAGVPLAAGRESLAVITMPEDAAKLADEAARHAGLVVMKINKKLPALLEYAQRCAPHTAVLAHRLGTGDGEGIFDLTRQAVMPEGVGYLSTAIIRQKP